MSKIVNFTYEVVQLVGFITTLIVGVFALAVAVVVVIGLPQDPPVGDVW